MPKSLPLKGKTIVLTGSSKTKEVLNTIQSLGGESIFLPLIETRELIDVQDAFMLGQLHNFDWLIFTSQNAVDAFKNKMDRHYWDSNEFRGKIAAVGKKTAQLLEESGFQVSFMPSVFSADVFVNEFPTIAGENPKCLFLKGNKAKDTLKKGLTFDLTEWTVYETYENYSNVQMLTKIVTTRKEPIIIFASPSAVDVYANNVASNIGWNQLEFAAIGHITADRIKHYGAQVTYMPKVYTMQAVIEVIQKGRENNHD